LEVMLLFLFITYAGYVIAGVLATIAGPRRPA
jgi:hypothetical protein